VLAVLILKVKNQKKIEKASADELSECCNSVMAPLI